MFIVSCVPSDVDCHLCVILIATWISFVADCCLIREALQAVLCALQQLAQFTVELAAGQPHHHGHNQDVRATVEYIGVPVAALQPQVQQSSSSLVWIEREVMEASGGYPVADLRLLLER